MGTESVCQQWLNFFLSGNAASGERDEQGIPISWARNKEAIKGMFVNLPDLDANDISCKSAKIIFFDLQENAYDESQEVMMILYNEATGHSGTWRGSLSTAYVPNGNEAWYEVTFKKLENIGMKDRSRWADFLGKEIPVWIDEYENKKGVKSVIIKSIGASKKKAAKSLDMRMLFGLTPIQEGFTGQSNQGQPKQWVPAQQVESNQAKGQTVQMPSNPYENI